GASGRRGTRVRPARVGGLREGRVGANGISIRYLESGPRDAPEAILFLHGGTGSGRRHWTGQLADFGRRGYRCLAPDHRGHAGTTNDRIGLDQELMALDAAGFLGALGIGRAHVVGFSVGGVVGIYLAIARPDLVGSLVTIGSHMAVDEHVRASNASVLPERILRDDPAWARSLAILHSAEQVADAWDGGVPRETDYWQRLCREIHDTWEVQPAWTEDDLRAIRCPALIGRGELDDRAVEEQIDRMAAAIDAAQTFVVPGAGHSFHTAEPGRGHLDRLLRDFLAAI
ncbi:MAG TPA: alpha/beta hydrolase, partial [Candidatus Limnocylindrales bacterium]